MLNTTETGAIPGAPDFPVATGNKAPGSPAREKRTVRTVDKKTRAKKLGLQYFISLVRFLFILGLSFVIIYPLLKNVSASFMSITDMYDKSVTYIPKAPTLDFYKTAIQMMQFPQSFLYTALFSLLAAVMQTFAATVTG